MTVTVSVPSVTVTMLTFLRGDDRIGRGRGGEQHAAGQQPEHEHDRQQGDDATGLRARRAAAGVVHADVGTLGLHQPPGLTPVTARRKAASMSGATSAGSLMGASARETTLRPHDSASMYSRYRSSSE